MREDMTAIHASKSHLLEMENRIKLKRVKDHVHEYGTTIVYRQYLIPAYAITQTSRAIWALSA